MYKNVCLHWSYINKRMSSFRERSVPSLDFECGSVSNMEVIHKLMDDFLIFCLFFFLCRLMKVVEIYPDPGSR